MGMDLHHVLCSPPGTADPPRLLSHLFLCLTELWTCTEFYDYAIMLLTFFLSL